ncbi:DUF1697 domain-containing protein [Paenibacillus pini]|uniref:Cytoplasmic protein n=1 Tax=Paenibacillus pini JCM 16418 TaxID=1236976 RepID=W7YIN5_9BACL|nr:DUF1697 domain-containing protein [Paenibacillus pini]GAF07478.1 hypothetical protein JCM16418_1495 [Paenibacillus pini JCM 16418]
MTIYIALLRGINVGGKNMIKMVELKRILGEMGLNRVQTYIQSGNVLFESNEDEEQLRIRIEREIEVNFGFPVPVILRTADELRSIAASCPFTQQEISEAEAASETESLYVSIMLEEPTLDKIERLAVYRNENENYRNNGREIYFLFRNSVRNSKLATHMHKLDVPATVRNWKTIRKLVTLVDAME